NWLFDADFEQHVLGRILKEINLTNVGPSERTDDEDILASGSGGFHVDSEKIYFEHGTRCHMSLIVTLLMIIFVGFNVIYFTRGLLLIILLPLSYSTYKKFTRPRFFLSMGEEIFFHQTVHKDKERIFSLREVKSFLVYSNHTTHFISPQPFVESIQIYIELLDGSLYLLECFLLGDHFDSYVFLYGIQKYLRREISIEVADNYLEV
ncbi:MAG: hypothetical protein LBG12_10160, partial [Synergistaceae bacterium]|nr:hypothetical protein [Synergistaceae bacterium]